MIKEQVLRSQRINFGFVVTDEGRILQQLCYFVKEEREIWCFVSFNAYENQGAFYINCRFVTSPELHRGHSVLAREGGAGTKEDYNNSNLLQEDSYWKDESCVPIRC